MKKYLFILLTIALFAVTVACNDTAQEEGMSIEDILNNSVDAMENLTSYSIEMDTQQSMGITEEESFDISSQLRMDLLLEPITFYQLTTMDMGIMGGLLSYDSYYSEEHGFFMEDPFTEKWGKFPDTLLDNFINLTDEQINPEEQLKTFLEYIDELTLTSDDNHYIISLKGEGMAMEALVDQIMGMSGETMNEVMDLMSDVEIHALDYEIFIDKETFYQVEAFVHLEMSMEIIGDHVTTTQSSHIIMSRFNELNDLTIPEDILENAVELTEEDIFGGF
ncbi:hypothetical protein J2S74_003218 [Evansella vedderi]|uniref:Lipoprotein n=1 Tax=Evansella vedderi TaxID=38282 RepID=A0ABT9ZYB0_9BACI|nr:DUF6612 family protein [Evansella vedderi]MDQ0255834.1 hypothetical protein [Evansella vedderi]